MVENRFLWTQHYTKSEELKAIVAMQAAELELLNHREVETPTGVYIRVNFLDTNARIRFSNREAEIKNQLGI